MGLLADAFSYGNTLKRKVNGLLADPVGTFELGVTRFGEDQNKLLGLLQDVMPGQRTVAPEVRKNALKELADYGAQAGMAGMFVGPKSLTWDKAAAAKAQEMANKGVDPRKIWSETGTWKGPDGFWRQEIPDNTASFTSDAIKELRDKAGKAQGKIFPHQELAAAYPESAQIWTAKELGVGGGSYANGQMGKSDMISLGLPKRGMPDIEELRGTNLHELQHAIQGREGWAIGGNASDIPDIIKETIGETQKRANQLRDIAYRGDPLDKFDVVKPGALDKALDAELQIRKLRDWQGRVNAFPDSYGFDAYKNLAGEAEARATQKRMNMDAAQRRATFPEDSYDVPINNLIVRLLSK